MRATNFCLCDPAASGNRVAPGEAGAPAFPTHTPSREGPQGIARTRITRAVPRIAKPRELAAALPGHSTRRYLRCAASTHLKD